MLELERRGATFARLCTEDYPSKAGFTWTVDGAALELGKDALDASEISAVWWRRPVAPVIPVEDRSEQQAAWAAAEARAAWEGFWGSVEAHWVNDPDANARADRKQVQLREAHRLGLSVPPTLITNASDTARAFARAHRQVVCKALRNGIVPGRDSDRVLYTQRLDAAAFDQLDELGPEPYLFQALIEKAADVRVTVIGDRVFACRIASQSMPETVVDWRRGRAEDLHHEPIELDEETTRQLLELTATFGLRFAAIDLAMGRDDRFVFFEINPNGQWAWIEQLTGQPLSAALADELLRR